MDNALARSDRNDSRVGVDPKWHGLLQLAAAELFAT